MEYVGGKKQEKLRYFKASVGQKPGKHADQLTTDHDDGNTYLQQMGGNPEVILQKGHEATAPEYTVFCDGLQALN